MGGAGNGRRLRLNRRSRWWRTRWADVVLAMLGDSVGIVLDHDGKCYRTLR